MTTFTIKGERYGKTLIIKSGFTSREAAEDHPLRLSLYTRVWVDEAEPKPEKPKRAKGKSLEDHDAGAFALIEKAALEGARCPQTHPHGPLQSGSIGRLARAGKIYSEVFRHNFRRVTICVGRHAGKATADPPQPIGVPYRVTGKKPVTVRRSSAASLPL